MWNYYWYIIEQSAINSTLHINKGKLQKELAFIIISGIRSA